MINPGMMVSDRYEIVDRVGSGGMADVYKAKDHRLNRFIAIKILKQEYSNDAKFVTKFRVEAQSVAGLSHPNIVNVYDVGDDNGLYYIVMELVEGITLKKFIEKKGQLDVKEAIGIGIQIAQGMEAAHANHIIHRDIKPQNIIISKEGKVKVTDFGIAKAATSNTITSNAMGSVHYISPEQARGGYSDEKSDIYSLGVTMYEMISGKVPFEGESTVTVALAHIQEEAVPLEKINPDIPHSLSVIVQKCMNKKPDFRYMSAAALISDLKVALANPDGEYVEIKSDDVDSSPTIMISDADLEQIKEAPRAGKPQGVQQEKVMEADNENDSDDAIDPKLEKILKICSVVVGAVIVVVIILIVGKVSGWWGKSNNVTSEMPSPSPTIMETDEPSDVHGEIEVPNIVGYSLEEAEDMLSEVNLKWQLKPVESEEEANKVIKQEPEAGEEVEETTKITIYYSQGTSDVIIPDLKNYSMEDATTRLESIGLKVSGQAEEYSNSVEAGKVCGTNPVVGSGIKKGSFVTIIISKGPKSEMAIVPNIVGKKESIALEKLADRGLKGNSDNVSYIYSDKYEKGYVVSQSENAGTNVEVGTVIDYAVSLGPKVVETEPPVETPTPIDDTKIDDTKYTYIGDVTINGNPFEYEDETAMIKIVLTQDGQSRTVWKGNLGYDDFPKKFSITGWSDNNGTVSVYKDDIDIGNSYNVEFRKVAE